MRDVAGQIRALADGPHSPERTVEVARTVEEAVRVLAHATRTNAGIGYASTLYDLVGALETSAYGMRQVVLQARDWLIEHECELTFDGADRHDVMSDVIETGAVTTASAMQLCGSLNALHRCLGVIGGPISEGDAR